MVKGQRVEKVKGYYESRRIHGISKEAGGMHRTWRRLCVSLGEVHGRLPSERLAGSMPRRDSSASGGNGPFVPSFPPFSFFSYSFAGSEAGKTRHNNKLKGKRADYDDGRNDDCTRRRS